MMPKARELNEIACGGRQDGEGVRGRSPGRSEGSSKGAAAREVGREPREADTISLESQGGLGVPGTVDFFCPGEQVWSKGHTTEHQPSPHP